MHLAHQIANGETHKLRGDADRVKAMELGYKALGVIQPISNRRRNRGIELIFFGSFSHDPDSGLAGILFAIVFVELPC